MNPLEPQATRTTHTTHTALTTAVLTTGLLLAGCTQAAEPETATAPAEEASAAPAEEAPADTEPVDDTEDPDLTAQEVSAPLATEPPAGAVAHYAIEDDLESAVAGAPALATEGQVELVDDDDPSGDGAAEFGQSGGFELDVGDLLEPEHYTVAMRFHLDRGADDHPWFKLIDFKDGTTDRGFYAYNGSLQVFGHDTIVGGDAPLDGPPSATVVLRRDHEGTMSWFVDGTLAASTPDSDLGVGVSEGSLRFFLDDEANDSGAEESSGRVSWISIFDEPLDDAAIAALSGPAGDEAPSALGAPLEVAAGVSHAPR